MVARIPYLTTEPSGLLLASEVATVGYLRARGIPIPEVYGYSTTSDNPAGTEYIFMAFQHGTNLGDIWFELGENARIGIVRKLVELETRLFSLQFPASGSLYYRSDLETTFPRIDIETPTSSDKRAFCVGPDMTLALWYGGRRALDCFRGPCESSSNWHDYVTWNAVELTSCRQNSHRSSNGWRPEGAGLPYAAWPVAASISTNTPRICWLSSTMPLASYGLLKAISRDSSSTCATRCGWRRATYSTTSSSTA